MKPYLVRFIEDVQSGKESLDATPLPIPMVMQEQNPQLYRRLRDGGELDRSPRAEWSIR
jgi:hypothetical protein